MTPYLYILMRTDLASLNPGKAVAQGAHAANQMVKEAWDYMAANDVEPHVLPGLSPFARPDLTIGRVIEGSIKHGVMTEGKSRALALAQTLIEWQTSTPLGFGTTITLGVNESQLRLAVQVARIMGFHAGITHDPTYPVDDSVRRDGEVRQTMLPDGGLLVLARPTVANPPRVTHLIPLDTCGYVFGDKDALKSVLGNFELMA